MQHIRQEHKLMLGAGIGGGYANDPGQRTRRLHQRHVCLAAKGVNTFQADGKIQAFVEDARKRMHRIQSQRAQHRHQLAQKVLVQPLFLLLGPLLTPDHTNVFLRQSGQQNLVEAMVLIVHQLLGAGADFVQGFGGREPVRIGCR